MTDEEYDYKPYTAKRWTEIPVPRVIGHREYTPEESEKNDRDMERIMREYGVLEPDERIEKGEVIKDNTTSQ